MISLPDLAKEEGRSMRLTHLQLTCSLTVNMLRPGTKLTRQPSAQGEALRNQYYTMGGETPASCLYLLQSV